MIRYFIFFILFPIAGIAQQYNFRNYSVKEGVAQSQVYSLLQDSRGYLWMGTRGGGLSRFDGIEFKTFTVKEGLINNYVFCIKEDVSHNLWIGTNNGLSRYNGIRFKNYYLRKNLGQVWIQDMVIDSKGRKWLATNAGVVCMDDTSFIYVTEVLKDKKTVINAIHVDKKGDVWYGNTEGLFKITSKGNNFHLTHYDRSKGFMNNSITTIKEDAKGNLWIGTFGDGAYFYNGKHFRRIDQNAELYQVTVLDIYFDAQHNIWFSTLNHGAGQYNVLTRSFSWLTEQEGLSNNHVRSIIQDKSGNYWFGTSGGGVCNYSGKQFTLYDKSSGLGGNFIYSIFRDSQHRLWIGNSDKGITVMDSSRFINYDESNGFANVKVKAIAEDSNGLIYLGTDGQGLFTYNGTIFTEIPEFKRKYIRAITKDNKENLWVATAGSGLYKLSIGNSIQIDHLTTRDGLMHNRLTCLHFDKAGRLWYGTENNGIGLLIDTNVQPLRITTNEGLPANSIRCMSEDKNGNLWLGTAGDGIAYFPIYQQTFPVKKYNHTDGLTSSNIYLICTDEQNNIFTGTENGLDQLHLDKNRKLLSIKHYGKGEGFSGIETCQNSVFKEKDGTIWFGTINGLTKYNPANQIRNEHPPITNISNVRLFYEPITNSAYAGFVGDWNQLKQLVLPHDQNHLTFDFSAINFSNPEAVRYQWKLEGFDKNWSPVSAQHSFSYPNLSPGEYTFMVKACNEDGVWNIQPVTLTFYIESPLWMKWWFIALLLALLITLLLISFKWRVNRIQTKANEAQKKIQMEKEIMELEQKALRLQMNPHFIFNALNSIQSQIGTDNEQNARYYLAKFSRLMRQILDNSRHSTISLEEEVHTLENYLLIEKFCNGDRFTYSIKISESLEKDYVRIPPMLLQPFIENAIKHGMKYSDERKGHIEVLFSEKNHLLECAVIDNGIGRKKAEEITQNSKETYHKSTALLVTQERLDLLSINKDLRSLEILDLHNELGEAIGTKVIIRIPLD